MLTSLGVFLFIKTNIKTDNGIRTILKLEMPLLCSVMVVVAIVVVSFSEIIVVGLVVDVVVVVVVEVELVELSESPS